MTGNLNIDLHICVTGHRFIGTRHALATSTRSVINEIMASYGDREIYLYSALAEGSDQLVASIAMETKAIKLVVPLPLPVDTYLQEFTTDEAKHAFWGLHKVATRVIFLPGQEEVTAAYDQLAEYLVEHADVLIALWNGEYSMKKGGAGALVRSALQAMKPVYWIYCDNLNDGSQNGLSSIKEEGDIELLHPASQI